MNDKHSNHIKAFLEYSCRTAADLLFPRRCPVCGGVAMPKGRLICPACLKQLSFVSSPLHEVRQGNRKQRSGILHGLHPPEKELYEGVRPAQLRQQGAVSMAAVKYHNKREYLDSTPGRRLCGLKAVQAGGNPGDCASSRPRFQAEERGFNQAAVLAEKLSAELGIPWEELLIRVKKTDPQKSLGSAERLKNLRGAFEAEQEAGKWNGSSGGRYLYYGEHGGDLLQSS